MMKAAVILLVTLLAVAALKEKRIFQQARDYLLFEAEDYTSLVDGVRGDNCRLRKEAAAGEYGIRAPGRCTSGSGLDTTTSKANYLLQFKYGGKYELWARVANSRPGNNGAYVSRALNSPPSHPVHMFPCQTNGCNYGFGWTKVGSGSNPHTVIAATGDKLPVTFQVSPKDDIMFDKFAFVSTRMNVRVNLAEVMVSHPLEVEIAHGPSTSFEQEPGELAYSASSTHTKWVDESYQFSGSTILRFKTLLLDPVIITGPSMVTFNLAFPDPADFAGTHGLRMIIHGKEQYITAEKIGNYEPGRWIRHTVMVESSGNIQLFSNGGYVLIDNVRYMEDGEGGTCCTDVSRFPSPFDGCISNMVITQAQCRALGGTYMDGLDNCDKCKNIETDRCVETDMLFVIDSSVEDLQACKDFVNDFFATEGLSSTGLRAGALFFGSKDDNSRASGLIYDTRRIKEIIEYARPSMGATCISCGLRDAATIFETQGRDHARKIAVIITDGNLEQTATGPSSNCAGQFSCARDFFQNALPACSSKDDEDNILNACSSYLQARTDIVSSILVMGDGNDEAVVKSLASSEDYFYHVKDTANLINLVDACEALACVPPLLATTAGLSPATCTDFSPNLSTVGTFKLSDHPTGSVAPPTFCLRLDELVPGIGTFSCGSWELFLSVDFPQNIIHIYGTVNGGLDTGNGIPNPSSLNIRMVYTGLSNVPGENGGTAVIAATPAFGTLSFGGNTYNVQSSSMGEHLRIQTGTAGAPADTYVVSSGAGFIQVALPGNSFSGDPIVNDFLAVVGPCVADRFDATAPLCTLPDP